MSGGFGRELDGEFDRHGLEVLHRDECLRLLGDQPVGRMGLCMNALPVVLPVNFLLATPPDGADQLVIVRSAKGAKLTAALDGAVVAFEVDGYDPMSHSGWSVLVQGLSRVLREEPELDWASTLPLKPWAIDGAHMYIALDTDVVRGRRFGTATPFPL